MCQGFFSSVFSFCETKGNCQRNYASGIRFSDCSKLAINWKNDNDITIFWHDVSVNFFFDVVLFLLPSSGIGPSFMSILSLALELWQFTFISNWLVIRKSEIPPYPRLSFSQYLKTRASQGYQIWHGCP